MNSETLVINTEPAPQKIAVIEDDTDLLESMVEHLNIKGYVAWGVNSAESFYKQLLSHSWIDLVIVDIGLSGENGFGIIQHLRDTYGMQHAIIITSAYDALNDRLNGLRIGADCYMVKPVDMEELIENIKAIFRNKYVVADTLVKTMSLEGHDNLSGNISVEPNTAQFNWLLSTQYWILTSPSNKVLSLTNREYRLLHLLISAQGQTVTKLDVVDQIIGKRCYNGNERLDVLLARLRKKTKTAMNVDLPIKTAHSLGYAFTAPAIIE